MAYTSGTLRVALEVPGVYSFKLWIYDTTDTAATVDTAGYISDAKQRGMNKGDLILRRTWTSLPTRSTGMQTADDAAPVLSTMGWHACFGLDTNAAELTDALAQTMTNTD